MTYTKPTISSAVAATAAIQSGSQKPSTANVDSGLQRIQTPNAYEADE